jgi:hypothetical protein
VPGALLGAARDLPHRSGAECCASLAQRQRAAHCSAARLCERASCRALVLRRGVLPMPFSWAVAQQRGFIVGWLQGERLLRGGTGIG